MEPFYDPAALDEFKTAINYSQLKADLPKRPDIFIDWHEGFGSLTVEGEEWVRMKDTSPSIVGDYHALLSTHYVKDDVYISVKAHVFSQGNQQSVFDYMLTLMASTSLPEVPYSLIPAGPGDIYFASPQLTSSGADEAGYILLSNIILVVETADTSLNIRPFSRELVNKVAKKIEDAGRYSPPKFSAAPERSSVEVEDTFSIKYQSRHLSKLVTALGQESINDKFEVIVKDKDHVELKALAPGEHQIPIFYMDVDTLYSNCIDVPVVVSP